MCVNPEALTAGAVVTGLAMTGPATVVAVTWHSARVAGVHSQDTTGLMRLMRRMIKEDLLTFEGKPLFPERVAETVPYELSPPENELYAAVTDYVRHEMNRADKLDPSRRNTVGFALTVLQRRLAPVRRRSTGPFNGANGGCRSVARRSSSRPWASTATASQTRVSTTCTTTTSSMPNIGEELETTLVDSATSAATLAELEAELLVLTGLEALASRVRESGEDRKWFRAARPAARRDAADDRHRDSAQADHLHRAP